MPVIKAAVLGIVQGLTEFLPVSSSGHLVFFQTVLGMKEPMLSFDIALHAGTLVAVLVYFHKEFLGMISDFWRFVAGLFCPCARINIKGDSPHFPKEGASPSLWFYVLLTLVPTGIMAVCFKGFIESAFSNLTAVSVAWLIMGILLIASAKIRPGTKDLGGIGWLRSLGIGLIQGFALMPGISRSGSTILAGMFLGIKREDAAKFSFLISIPAVLAAIVMDLKESLDYFSSYEVEVLTGFFAAAVSGYLVIKWLMGIIHKGRFHLFGFYCILISAISFALTFILR